MNKSREITVADFRGSISSISTEEQTSIIAQLDQEISFTEQELRKSYALLKVAKNEQKTLQVFKYEQTVRDIELELEKLQRKKEMYQLKTQNIDDQHAPKSIPNGSSMVSPKSIGPAMIPNYNTNYSKDESTKGLPKKIEKMNSTSTAPSYNSYTTDSRPPVYNTFSLPKQTKSINQPSISQSSKPLFTEIKLKKVGLPPDAQEYDQNDFPSATVEKKDSFKRRNTSPYIPPIQISSRSPSVDFSRSIDITTKDKFHNPNKEIQVAIQNEIKEIRLKKTNLSSPPLNCSIEHVSMGKFNFSNEKSLSTNNSVVTPLSTSKSMPFLNSISSSSYILNEARSSPSFQLTAIEEHLDVSYDENPCLDSILKDWDPTIVLKKLYIIQRKSNKIPSSNRRNEKVTFDVEYIMGSNNGRSWTRGSVSILNGQMSFYEKNRSLTAANIFDLKEISDRTVRSNTIEIRDSRGIYCNIRCLTTSDCNQLLTSVDAMASNIINEIIPSLYENVTENHSHKVLVVDIGSCSVRAGLLKVQPTLPGLYFPHVAAISKESQDVMEVGFEAFDSKIAENSDIIRPLKPDTTLEHLAFKSGSVEATITKVANLFGINPKEYIIMLSVPHNIAESTRSKLADVILLRLNFKGVSMCGESLLALHAYGEPTGVLVDIGYRTEILPVTYGVVQTSSVRRSLFGGHLVQVALSHMLPFELHSITDFLLVRLIMEEVCVVAKNSETAHNYSEGANIDLSKFNLPSHMQSSLVLQGKDRCLPIEGLFNPDIYSMYTCGLSEMIKQSIQSCPMDFRKDLYKSIYLSGATTQIPGLVDRLEHELRKDVPNNCEVKVYAAPDRSHFSYVGACFVASSEDFLTRVVNRREWEDDRMSSLRKWHF